MDKIFIVRDLLGMIEKGPDVLLNGLRSVPLGLFKGFPLLKQPGVVGL